MASVQTVYCGGVSFMFMFFPAKRARRFRTFVSGDAVNPETNYYVDCGSEKDELFDLIDNGQWVLLTGPYQSGKTSLIHALADKAQSEGYVAVVTTLRADMVRVANSIVEHEEVARKNFFAVLAALLESDSMGQLRPNRELPDMMQITSAFSGDGKKVIWFIDEASLLNSIQWPFIVDAFLSGLRNCKEARKLSGGSRLHSLMLVGTGKTHRLIASARWRPSNVSSHPSLHDPYHPNPNSRLSLERSYKTSSFSVEDIQRLITFYADDRRVSFRIMADEQVTAESEKLALRKFASNIYGLTSGYKGMVGACCVYICQEEIHTLAMWRIKVRQGQVAKRVFSFGRVVSNVLEYSVALQQVVLECVLTGGPVATSWSVDLLPAINDGVLVKKSGKVSLSSSLLLATLLENCKQTYQEQLPEVDNFEDAVRAAFSFMKHDRLTMEKVLDANRQPFEYMWQLEFLLGLKFVFEYAYHKANYKILVEARKRQKGGQTTRLDFSLRSGGLLSRGFEVQGEGNADSIRKHIARCKTYGRLLNYKMHYVYFVLGQDKVGAKEVIIKEKVKVDHPLEAWYVQYLLETRKWNIQKLQHDGTWDSHQVNAPSSYPSFTLDAKVHEDYY